MRTETRSTKLLALVVDDEPLARSNLLVLLRKDADIESVGECESGVEAVREIRRTKPDLVFLDVEMPECDGFDVLELLGNNLPPAVVFVTAYDQYALRAFDAGALDYLLKPFDNTRFELALERAKGRVEAAKIAPRKVERIAVKSAGQVVFVKVAEIDWIEAADYYVALHVAGKAHLLRRSMAELEEELEPSVFCRIHRSTMVNLDRVRALESGEEDETIVVLDGGARLRMSRRYRKVLQERLGVRER